MAQANGTNGNGTNGANGHNRHAPNGTPPQTSLTVPKPLPRLYDEETVNELIERISAGASLRSACRDAKISAPTLRRWIVEDIANLGERYARARELQAEAWADEIKELADVCEVGTRREIMPDGGVKIYEGDMLERAKLRIDARKWLMSKIVPKKYGDSVGAGISVQNAVFMVDPFADHRAFGEERPVERLAAD